MVIHHFGDVSGVVSKYNTVRWQVLGVLLVVLLHPLLVLLPLHLAVCNPPYKGWEIIAGLGLVRGLVLPSLEPREAQNWLICGRVRLGLTSCVGRGGCLLPRVGPTGSNIIRGSFKKAGVLNGTPCSSIGGISYLRIHGCLPCTPLL